MILQALHDLYQRKINDGSGALAAEGWEWKEIPFILVIDRNGKLVSITDTRRVDAKKRKRAQTCFVPQGVKKTSGVAANLLWDAPAYILGYKPDMKPERLQETQAAFREKITALFSRTPADEGIAAVLAFLDSAPLEQAQAQKNWNDIAETMPFMTFRLDGDSAQTVCERSAVRDALAHQEADADAIVGTCLITGRDRPIARLHPPIKGVAGTQSTGGNIVSFNLEAFASYGKQQGENAPISVAAANAYTKALNELLGKDSAQKLQLDETTVVFWAQRQEAMEDELGGIFADDPLKHSEAVKQLYTGPDKGVPPQYDTDTLFYVLGLAPNAARISVRFWHAAPIKDFVRNIRRYFDDIALDAFGGENPWPRQKQLLAACATDHKLDRLPSTLSAQLFDSIVFGTPYPLKLMHLALARARAEAEVPDNRAALLKACLIRNFKQEVSMGLDENKPEVGYQLGRLFAVYDYIKVKESKKKANRCDKYFSAFSTRPEGMFKKLRELAGYDLQKLSRSQDTRGFAVLMEKEIQSIMQRLRDIPLQLSVADQALFVIGFYHQKENWRKDKEMSASEAA